MLLSRLTTQPLPTPNRPTGKGQRQQRTSATAQVPTAIRAKTWLSLVPGAACMARIVTELPSFAILSRPGFQRVTNHMTATSNTNTMSTNVTLDFGMLNPPSDLARAPAATSEYRGFRYRGPRRGVPLCHTPAPELQASPPAFERRIPGRRAIARPRPTNSESPPPDPPYEQRATASDMTAYPGSATRWQLAPLQVDADGIRGR